MKINPEENIIQLLSSRKSSRSEKSAFYIRKSEQSDCESIWTFYTSHIGDNNVLRKKEVIYESVYKGHFFHVEDSDKRLYGIIGRYIYPVLNQQIIEIGTLLFDKALKGKSISRCLIDLQIEDSIKYDSPRSSLFVSGVFEHNKPVIDKYTKLGWVYPPNHLPIFMDYFLQTCAPEDYRTKYAKYMINWFFYSPETLTTKADIFDIRKHLKSVNVQYSKEIEILLDEKEVRNQLLFEGGTNAISHKA